MKYGIDFIRHLKHILNKPDEDTSIQPPMDNEASRSQPQQISTETQTAISSFVEKLDTSPVKLTKNFTEFTDEDFRKVGFTEQHIREIRGVLQFIDNALTIQTEKDMKIGELETKLSALNKKYIKSMEDNIDLAEKQIKEKQELLDQLNEEKCKKQEMRKVVETQVQRLKNIIRNKLKDPTSKISLNDRVKARFKLDGVTIATIIGVVGMIFTAIGFAIGTLWEQIQCRRQLQDLHQHQNHQISQIFPTELKKD